MACWLVVVVHQRCLVYAAPGAAGVPPALVQLQASGARVWCRACGAAGTEGVGAAALGSLVQALARGLGLGILVLIRAWESWSCLGPWPGPDQCLVRLY